MIRIIFVDDEPKLRRAWAKLFAARDDMQLVASISRADELLSAVEASPPHVAIVDLTMPGLSPIEAIRVLNHRFPDVRAVVYSARGDRELLSEAFDAGAWGYIDKLAAPSDVFDVILRVANGECVFPPDVMPGPDPA